MYGLYTVAFANPSEGMIFMAVFMDNGKPGGLVGCFWIDPQISEMMYIGGMNWRRKCILRTYYVPDIKANARAVEMFAGLIIGHCV